MFFIFERTYIHPQRGDINNEITPIFLIIFVYFGFIRVDDQIYYINIGLTYNCTQIMNFDSLDDDLDIGYTPTIAANSRAGSMKKISKKPEVKVAPVVTKKKQDDFDFLDDLLDSPPKTLNNNKATEKAKSSYAPTSKNNNDIDSFFDEPTIPISNKSISKNEKPNPSLPMKSATITNNKSSLSMPMEDTILEENETKLGGFKFKKPEVAPPPPTPPVMSKKNTFEQQFEVTINPSTSTRMMKPPLRKKETEKNKQQSKYGGFGAGLSLTLPQQGIKSTNLALSAQDNSKFKIPENSRRRSSIQMKDLQLDQTFKNMPNKVLPVETKTEKFSGLSGIPPPDQRLMTENHLKQKWREETNNKTFEPKLEPHKERGLWDGQKSLTINQFGLNNNYSRQYPNNSMEAKKKVEEVPKGNRADIKQEVEKEVEFMKKNYQKHIDLLQSNLEEQIKSNKEVREKLMKETNLIIENERSRLKRVHEDQMERVKQMNEWEKKRMEDHYSNQIGLLKNQINKYEQALESTKPIKNQYSKYGQKKELDYLEDRLRMDKKILEDKIKIIEKRQFDLEERQKEFNKRKRLEEQRLRNQEKRIFQYQMDAKKMILGDKRRIEDEKQSIATQLATIQLGAYKKEERINQLQAELQQQKEQMQKERRQLKNLNNNLILEFQKKIEQIENERQKIVKRESELVNKLKIVEEAKWRMAGGTAKEKENNWVNGSLGEESFKRGMSAQKVNNHKKLQQTQNRFSQLAENVKDSVKFGNKNKTFNIDSYIMSMAQYTRNKIE